MAYSLAAFTGPAISCGWVMMMNVAAAGLMARKRTRRAGKGGRAGPASSASSSVWVAAALAPGNTKRRVPPLPTAAGTRCWLYRSCTSKPTAVAGIESGANS